MEQHHSGTGPMSVAKDGSSRAIIISSSKQRQIISTTLKDGQNFDSVRTNTLLQHLLAINTDACRNDAIGERWGLSIK